MFRECACYLRAGPEKACCGSGEAACRGESGSGGEGPIVSFFEVRDIMYAVPMETLVLGFFRVHLAEGPLYLCSAVRLARSWGP